MLPGRCQRGETPARIAAGESSRKMAPSSAIEARRGGGDCSGESSCSSPRWSPSSSRTLISESGFADAEATIDERTCRDFEFDHATVHLSLIHI
eukprot:5323457-Prymnesium_polylepis.1